MKQSEALKKWKKDKPTLLTDTGVSDVLRKLPEDWLTLIDISAVETVLKDLTTRMADKKISESKSATACLTAIRTAVKDYLEFTKKDRTKGVDCMKDIHAVVKKFYELCESKKLSASASSAYQGSISNLTPTMNIITGRGRDFSAVPGKSIESFKTQMDLTIGITKRMTVLFEDAEIKVPKFDMTKELPALIKEFKKNMDKMPAIWEAVARLP